MAIREYVQFDKFVRFKESKRTTINRECIKQDAPVGEIVEDMPKRSLVMRKSHIWTDKHTNHRMNIRAKMQFLQVVTQTN